MEAIGKAAVGAVARLTDSPPHFAKQLATKPELRAPTTAEEARALKVWAEAQSDRPVPASTSELAKHLEFLAATLPSKVVDEESGKRRVAVYARILGGYSNAALAFMARTACERLNWFPTPHQCLEILSEYVAPVSDRDRALMLCQGYWQGKFDDFIAALQGGDADEQIVDEVPDQWRRIAVERGYLRYLTEDQRYIIRRPVTVEDDAGAAE